MKDRLEPVYSVVRDRVIPDDPAALQAEIIELADSGRTPTSYSPVEAPGSHRATARRRRRLHSSILRFPASPKPFAPLRCSKRRRAMLSRALAGVRGRTLVINLPGKSSRGSGEPRHHLAGPSARARVARRSGGGRVTRIASFTQAERYLLETIDEVLSRRTSYKLDRMYAFLRELGDPHRAYPTIHVGGTSGKGSTCAMISSALQAAGRHTGLHTKPHLHSMTERARIDGRPIAPERFAELLDEMMPAIERTTARYGRPTYYETLLALAFTYFARERVDVAVIEVGLGGRLDGTNVIVPLVAAITTVGFDHTDVLGTTIEEIAFEKAGIAKQGIPLVVGSVPAAAHAVIARYAAEIGAKVDSRRRPGARRAGACGDARTMAGGLNSTRPNSYESRGARSVPACERAYGDCRLGDARCPTCARLCKRLLAVSKR